MPKQKKTKKQRAVDFDTLKQINLHAAGLDIGAAEIWACVPPNRDEQSVKCFKTFTVDLHALADWLQACGIKTVAMESTGVYWVPIYEILDERGFDLKLVNAQHLKRVPGRKSDVQDCQWVQQLHTYGLLQGSFHPEPHIRTMRAYARQRTTLLQCRGQHIQHMQKALHLMNIQLTNVISDITGQTGLKIIRAIIAGERDPHKLTKFRNTRCRKSEKDIAKALDGHYQPEHIFALQQALELYDTFTDKIKACETQLLDTYQTAQPQVDLNQQPLPPPRRSTRDTGNCPDYDLRRYLYQLSGVDLTQIDGVNTLTAQTVITEVGFNMRAWPTVKHFTSWLGLAPYQDISGGRVLKTRTKRSNNRANTALRMAAQGLAHSQSPLGHYYRRLRARHGPAKAITATAHKLARIIYHMLKHQQPFDPHKLERNQQQLQQRRLKQLRKQAQHFGFKLVETT